MGHAVGTPTLFGTFPNVFGTLFFYFAVLFLGCLGIFGTFSSLEQSGMSVGLNILCDDQDRGLGSGLLCDSVNVVWDSHTIGT